MRARTALLALALIAVGTPIGSNASERPMIEPGVLNAAGPIPVMARFRTAVPVLPELAGAYRFASVPAVAVPAASPAAVRALASHPDLVYLERGDKAIVSDLDSAGTASRVRSVWSGADPITLPGGAVVDGTGVGIAIVDSGLDGLHPDFAAPGKVGGNWQVTPAGLVAATYTSTVNNAHGTHVAGIAAGPGTTDTRFVGTAPGATLYGFNMYNGVLVQAAIAFDWIIQNGASQTPPIRVVNNSWHCEETSCVHPFNQGQLHMALASQMATSGIVVTWSVGNEVGTGEESVTNPEANIQTPGIIGVANYDDQNSGERNRCLSGSSSYGESGDPLTWPDVSAPGTDVVSTWAAGASASGLSHNGRNPATGSNTYRSLSGTSMAAPHVAGMVALMLQAMPSLTPADVEYIVKQTATPLTGNPSRRGCGVSTIKADPAHPWTGSNYAAGHGLVDARAAVVTALSFGGIPPLVPTEEIPDSFIVDRPGIRADRVLYLHGESGFTTDYPDRDQPRVRVMEPDGVVVHTSDPFTSPITIDSLKVDVYLGTTSEASDAFSIIGEALIRARVEHVSGPTATLIAEVRGRNHPVRTLWPVHRRMPAILAQPVTFASGDRLRLMVEVITLPYQGVQPAINGWWDLYSEGFTASRVELGTLVPRPSISSRPGCERDVWCAQVDETHPYEGIGCGQVPFHLRWRGPVGSALIFHCDGIVTTCPVVTADAGSDEGTCEAEVLVDPATTDRGAWCTYRLPSGGRGGEGTCFSLTRVSF